MKKSIKRAVDYLLHIPLYFWIGAGFLVAYYLLFITPSLFNSSGHMYFFTSVPITKPGATDLQQMLSYSNELTLGRSPYIGQNLYPPLASLLFLPLLTLPFSIAYQILTAFSLLSYLGSFALIAKSIKNRLTFPAIVLPIAAIALFGYGLQFELERGQFNLIPVFFVLLGAWLFHNAPRWRALGYILFIIAVQIKFYPIIFILLFINNWKAWREIGIRFASLIAVNIGLFFILGQNIFHNFFTGIREQTLHPYVWIGNHSIKSFVSLTTTKLGEPFYFSSWDFLALHQKRAQALLLLIVLGSVLLTLLRAYRVNAKGIDPYLLLSCTLAALLIPSVSHDYKLSLLAVPIAYVLTYESTALRRGIGGALTTLTVFAISLLYATTLFSYENKSQLVGSNMFAWFFQNNFPALFLLLLCVAALAGRDILRSSQQA